MDHIETSYSYPLWSKFLVNSLGGPRLGGTDPESREKIKAYPASRRIFLPYPASRRILAFCIVFTKK